MYPNRPSFEAAGDDAQPLLRRFRDEGYVVADFSLADAVIDQAMEELEPQWRGPGGSLSARRVHDAWRFSKTVKEIAGDSRVRDWLTRLYGRKPIPFQTLNFATGTEQLAHADVMHFNTIPAGFVCGVWVAYEDTDGGNGPFCIYPGSHFLPGFEIYDALGTSRTDPYPCEDQYKHYEAFVGHMISARGLEPKEIHLKRGQFLIWSGTLYHGGASVVDRERTRFSQVTHYFFEGCTYYSPRLSNPYFGNYWLRRVKDVCTGEEVGHILNGQPLKVPGRGRYRFDASGQAVWLDKPPWFSRWLDRSKASLGSVTRKGRKLLREPRKGDEYHQ